MLKNNFLLLVIVLSLLFVVGCGSSPNITVHPSATKTTTAPLPKTIEELPTFLENSLPPEAKGKVYITKSDDYPNHYMVLSQFEMSDSIGMSTMMKRSAYDFIFDTYHAVYASDLPVISSTIVMSKPDGRLGLSVTVGRKYADANDVHIWSEKKIGPSNFLKWVRDRKNNNYDFANKMTILGEYAND